jgi:hypothetical protein
LRWLLRCSDSQALLTVKVRVTVVEFPAASVAVIDNV